jgi:hypothetical protein
MFLLKWLKRKKPAKKSRPRSLPFSEEQIRAKAYEIWQERMRRGAPPQDDWHAAIQRLKQERSRRWQKPFCRLLSWVNQRLIWLEKHVNEPLADWFERAAIFKIVEKLSPILEAVGVLLIPVAVWWFSQSYQVEKDKQERATRQQDAIKTYLNQLTTTFLDGDIKKDKNLQKVTRASTLALLQDPNMTGAGKGQVITFLSEIGLIHKEKKSRQKLTKVSAPPVLSLSNADLRDADLSSADLSSADLSYAKLSGAQLSGADLRDANLFGAKLSADLSRARGLIEDQLQDASLCQTQLPPDISLNPNRDCKALGLPEW